MIGFTCSAVAIQMLVELGVKNPLGERLLQFVNQTIFIEHVFRIASGQKLVKQVFLDCHMMLHPFSSSWPHTQDSGQSRYCGLSDKSILTQRCRREVWRGTVLFAIK